MSLHVTVIPRPSPLWSHAARSPLWQQQQRLAAALAPQMQQGWYATVMALRQALPTTDLQDALLGGQSIVITYALTVLWDELVSAEVQQWLLPLVYLQIADLLRMLTPSVRALQVPDSRLRLTTSTPALQTALSTYVDTLLHTLADRAVTALSMRVQQGLDAGQSVPDLIRTIRNAVGLTVTQAASLDTYHTSLLEEGVPEAQAQGQVRLRSERALRLHAELFGATVSMDAIHTMTQTFWQEQVAAGALNPDEVRRLWVIDGTTACAAICAPIPALNPHGVRLTEPFQTPIGELMGPTAHPRCRCTLALGTVASPADFVV